MISIIIANYNGEKYIKACLDSIFASNYQDFEIIFVDDCSNDNSVTLVKNYESVKLIENKTNLGPSISRNKGAESAKGNLLFFLDVDTKINPDCLKNIVKEFKQNKIMGAAQAQLLKYNSKLLDSAGHYLSPFGFPYEIGVNQPAEKFKQKKKILGGKSAGLIIRKNLFEKINGFDKDYFIYGEDTDLCWRVWLSEYQVYYLPNAKVYHHQKSSLNKKTRYRVFYEGAKNNLNYLLKNLSFLQLFWVIPLHLLAWIIIMLKQLITGNFTMAFAVFRGLFWNLINLGKTINKRPKIKSKKISKKILFGKIKFSALIHKGKRWFSNA